MANNLSLSLWRNSSIPKNSESPVANNEAINKIGNSSIRLGIREAPTLQGFNCEEETLKSPTSSLPNFLIFSIFISASMEFKTSKRAILVEFKPTSLIKIEESGVINAPTIMKAADEKSPGTLMSLPSNSSCPDRVISELIVFKFMPNCWNINSV